MSITPQEIERPPREKSDLEFSSPLALDASQAQRHVTIDPLVEKRLVRKLDRVIIPVAWFLYLLAFLSRSNIGNAQTAGMGNDLGFDDAHYQVCCLTLSGGELSSNSP